MKSYYKGLLRKCQLKKESLNQYIKHLTLKGGNMQEIRFHGRGGQGAVIASKILAISLFKEGKRVLAYPQFGVERRGAPVLAFLRIQDKEDEITLRSGIYNPDFVVVLDPILMEMVNVFEGIKGNGIVVINSRLKPEDVATPFGVKVATVDANSIAIKYGLGFKTQPIVNTAILGAFIKVTGLADINNLLKAIEEEIPVKVEENKKAAQEAYEEVIFKEE